jgi:hypothetical protein
VDYAQDFWHDYERVNGRGVTRAERRRIEAVAAQASWLQLLVWLDRWEQAHARDEMELNAGYFESCSAAEASTVNGPLGPSRQQPLRSTPAIQPQVDEPLVLPPEYDRVLARLRELGIRRAEALAKHAGTTLALVDAWWAASERQGVKNRHAYTAAGIATGKMPELIPARRVSAVEPAYEANVLPLLSVCADDAYGTVWRRVQATLAQQISSEAYTTWIAALRLLDVIGKAAIVAAPNVFVRNEVRERFETMIADELAHELGQRLEIEVVIDSSR